MPSKTSNSIAKQRLSFNVTEVLNKSSYKKFKPKEKYYHVRDKKLEGFYIRIYPSGKKSYGCYARKGGVGKPIHCAIGDCELLDFSDAKAKAKELLRQIKVEGINPKLHLHQEAIKDKTILDLADDFFRANKKLKESTKKDYLSVFNNRMPKLIKMPITEITLEEILQWWSDSKGQRVDVKAFMYARKLMDKATASRYVPENNFTRAKTLIGDFPSINTRTDHIAKDEIYHFFQNFLSASPNHGERPKRGKEMSHVMRDYLLFILITGKRRTESMSLKWSNVDFKRGTVTLDKLKGDSKIDVIPMTDVLFTMLDYRYHMNGNTQSTRKHPMWVFQSRSGDKHISYPNKALASLNKNLDLKFQLSSHDFRRTFATATRELGLSNEDLAILLNHRKRDVTEGYVQSVAEYKRNNLEEVSRLFNEESNGALSNIMALWYEGTSELLDPERLSEGKPSRMDYQTSKLHLLGRFEQDFSGYGHGQWKPSDELRRLGWREQDKKKK